MSDSVVLKSDLSTISIEEEMRSSYMEYAMSVIVSRALPDVRDGLKPVHRRILYAMEEGGYTANKAYKKSARIVGDVMGKYHPHGDSAIYDTMVRMAQDFSMRLPLIDGQGNFGSMDGDPPAAMRYTEARMARAAHDMTVDIDLGTVDFRPTYDNSDNEPVVLPTRIPNLLVNGVTGIAVGMATNIPPHNIAEVIDAMLSHMDDPEMTVVDIMNLMPGPDFPTGGVILGRQGIKDAYETGRGSITISGVSHVEEPKKGGGRTKIVITELPFALNKATFMERIAALVNDKVIEGVSDVRDESDRDESVRVIIELKRDGDPDIVLNKLKKHTRYIDSFGVNSVCLDSRGNPVTMGIKEIFDEFITFRRQVIRRRTIFELDRARDQLHRQIGLYAAVSMIDEVVRTIRQSPDVDTARQRLMAMEFPTEGGFAKLLREADPDLESVSDIFHLSEIQANAILELNLRRLTGMERDRIEERAKDLSGQIGRFLEILNNSELLDSILKQELLEIKEKYKTDRLTKIEAGEFDALSDDDLVVRRDLVMTLTRKGYIKTTPLEGYREQHRGGKGKSGMDIKDDDVVSTSLVCTTKTPLLFVTTRGIAHMIKAYRLPEMAAKAKGRPIVNLIESMRVNEGESIAAVIPFPEDTNEIEHKSIVFVTDFGDVRRNKVSDFSSINRGGKIAIRLEDDNGKTIGRLVTAMLCDEEDDVFLATQKGMSIRFNVGDLRIMRSRTSTGVRCIQLSKDDSVIGGTLLRGCPYTVDQRLAYLSGGSYTSTLSMKDEEDGNELENESFSWGEVTISIQKHPETGEDIAKRTIKLTDACVEDMKDNEEFLITISERGYGKRSSSYEFRTIRRGGKGLSCMNINKITGELVAAFPVKNEDGLVIITDSGQTIRTGVDDVRIQGRTTRGVILFRLPDDQKVVATAHIKDEGLEENGEMEEE